MKYNETTTAVSAATDQQLLRTEARLLQSVAHFVNRTFSTHTAPEQEVPYRGHTHTQQRDNLHVCCHGDLSMFTQIIKDLRQD